MLPTLSFSEYPLKNVLDILLQDKTTGKNIIFATDAYGTDPTEEITKDLLYDTNGCRLKTRVSKAKEQQQERTKVRAEVFTPSWICNKMNNVCDTEWFGYADVFNKEDGTRWETTKEKIRFGEGKTWQDYVLSTRLEITCGEAPYLVSRYDTTTGEYIAICDRIGMLDRKIRVIGENISEQEAWLVWVFKAFQSVYGYEFQGDNLLIARANLVLTFCEYLEERWGRKATDQELQDIAKIVVWNIWQMDGLTGCVPFQRPPERNKQYTLSEYVLNGGYAEQKENVECRIYAWEENKEVIFNSLKKEN